MKILCFVLIAAAALAAVLPVQNILPQTIGFVPSQGAAIFGVSNNGASSGVAAFSLYVPNSPFSGTARLKDIRLKFGMISGSPAVAASLYSDNGGVPGTLIETGSAVSLGGSGWYTLGGFTAASQINPDTLYWVVVKCTSGTSANIYFNYMASGQFSVPAGSTPGAAAQTWNAHTAVSSTNNGSGWATWRQMTNGIRIGLTDGSDDAYIGIPLDAVGTATGAAQKLYTNGGTSQEAGVHFTLPANAKFRVAGALMFLKQYGAANGDVRFKLYSGAYSNPTLLGTTKRIPGTYITTNVGMYFRAYFPAPIEITGGTEITLTANNTAADDANNYFAINGLGMDNDPVSAGLLPMGLSFVNYSGGAWSTGSTFMPFFELLLDDGYEFAASGGGGGGQSGYIYQQ